MDIRQIIDNYKLPIGLGLIGLVLIGGGWAFSQINKKEAPVNFPKESIVSSEKQIMVDVSGAVKVPGVYRLAADSRIESAIKAAGEVAENADSSYISKNINMAQKIVDGMKIYIPAKGEQAPPKISSGVVAGVSTGSQVNINSAPQAELEALPGIGPVSAAKIISGRPYQKVDDLLSQKIVGKSVFDKIKDLMAI